MQRFKIGDRVEVPIHEQRGVVTHVNYDAGRGEQLVSIRLDDGCDTAVWQSECSRIKPGRVICRVYGSSDWSIVAFLDSGAECNPGRICVWDEQGGHGEGYPRYVASDSRPVDKDKAAAILADYCGRYGLDPADYRIVSRRA